MAVNVDGGYAYIYCVSLYFCLLFFFIFLPLFSDFRYIIFLFLQVSEESRAFPDGLDLVKVGWMESQTERMMGKKHRGGVTPDRQTEVCNVLRMWGVGEKVKKARNKEVDRSPTDGLL
jgi:hypothetical protein